MCLYKSNENFKKKQIREKRFPQLFFFFIYGKTSNSLVFNTLKIA